MCQILFTYLEVKLAALILKNLQLASLATALASIVLPLPGGPNNNKPLMGERRPVNSFMNKKNIYIIYFNIL